MNHLCDQCNWPVQDRVPSLVISAGANDAPTLLLQLVSLREIRVG